MRKILTILLLLTSFALYGKNGFNIQVTYTDATDSVIRLYHYYGKSSEAYKIDSGYLDKKGNISFRCDTAITGGIYLIILGNQTSSFEVIVLNGDDMKLEVSKTDVYKNAKCIGSKENELYYDYQRYLIGYGKEYKELDTKLKSSKNAKDSENVITQLKAHNKVLQDYRKNIYSKHPNLFLSKLFQYVADPIVPDELPILPNGKKDTDFPHRYYKTHYWDNFNFKDDRIIYTPAYESKLENYFTRVIAPVPDTVNQEMNYILSKAKGSKDMYKYTLWYLTRWTENSKIMGLDESFVYLVENYYGKGLAPWIHDTTIKKYIKRAKEIAPCLLNQQIQDMTISDSSNTKRTSLYSINSEYTILLFWSPSCHTCQKELPLFDSLLKTRFKAYDMKILAVITADEVADWKKFISSKKLNDKRWIHGYDPTHTINFKSIYDVYSTPTLYLLDREKKILGKRLDHINIVSYMDFLEKKRTNTSQNK